MMRVGGSLYTTDWTTTVCDIIGSRMNLPGTLCIRRMSIAGVHT